MPWPNLDSDLLRYLQGELEALRRTVEETATGANELGGWGRFAFDSLIRIGGIRPLMKELLDRGLLHGDVLTCTGDTLAESREITVVVAAAPPCVLDRARRRARRSRG